MWHIIVQSLKIKKVALIAYCVASVLFLAMFAATYPSIQNQSEQFSGLLDAYPEGFTKSFNIESLSFDTFESYLAVEQMSVTWPIMVIFLAVSFAGSGIAREVERGTIEIILARPVSRLSFFFGRYVGGVISLAVFSIVSFLGTIPLAALSHIQYRASHYFVALGAGFLFGLAIFSLSTLCSVLFSERNKVYMSVGGILLGMYFAKILTNFEDSVETLQYISFFHYFDGMRVLVDGVLDTYVVIVLLACSAVCTIVAAKHFNKRDFAV